MISGDFLNISHFNIFFIMKIIFVDICYWSHERVLTLCCYRFMDLQCITLCHSDMFAILLCYAEIISIL